MKIGLFQFDVVHGHPVENHRQIVDGTRHLEIDLLVLPELCTSGYLLTPDEAECFAIELPSQHLIPFLDLARRLQACVVAGVIEKADGRSFNTAIVVGPDGWIGCQRKLHITKLERSLFQAGQDVRTFSFADMTFGIVTCFDAWFPEVARQLTRGGAQLLCQPAAFGGMRTLDIMRVRSMENAVFSVTSNRLGNEKRGQLTASFRGQSQIVDCEGNVLAQAGAEQQALVVEVDLRRANVKSSPMCDDLTREWERYYREPR